MSALPSLASAGRSAPPSVSLAPPVPPAPVPPAPPASFPPAPVPPASFPPTPPLCPPPVPPPSAAASLPASATRYVVQAGNPNMNTSTTTAVTQPAHGSKGRNLLLGAITLFVGGMLG